jgi:hypothetical protein
MRISFQEVSGLMLASGCDAAGVLGLAAQPHEGIRRTPRSVRYCAGQIPGGYVCNLHNVFPGHGVEAFPMQELAFADEFPHLHHPW